MLKSKVYQAGDVYHYHNSIQYVLSIDTLNCFNIRYVSSSLSSKRLVQVFLTGPLEPRLKCAKSRKILIKSKQRLKSDWSGMD